jgi:hypothetical protein
MAARTARRKRKGQRSGRGRNISSLRAARSLEEALDSGWAIHEQLSSWQFRTANKREGFLFLTRHGAGNKTLIVPYVALYELSTPYFLESEDL